GGERAGAGLGVAAVDLGVVQGMLAVVGQQGQVDDQPQRSLALAAQRPGQVGAEGGIDLALEFFETEEVGVEGVGVGVLAGGAGQAAAGLGDRGDPGRGGEEDGEEDGGGDLALAAELQMRLAEVDGEAIDSGGCQGGGGLAHSSLRKRWNRRKSVWEMCLSLPSPATPFTRKFGKY